jgi:DNA-binding NarL/FixJ family response regulator
MAFVLKRLEVSAMVSTIRLHICHRNRLFRECLAGALAGDGFADIRTSGAPEPGLPEASGQGDWDLLLIDAGLPDMMAFRLVEAVRAPGRDARIILMVPSSAPGLIESCLRAGADGCVSEDDTLDDLRRAIEMVRTGQSHCSPQVAHQLFTRADEMAPSESGVADGRDGHLTMREGEILRMIAYQNLSNKQIARELRLSIYTVKNHVHSIIEKLGAEDRMAAARHAVRRGLLIRSSR